jgi:6-phosphofructokinase
VVVTAEGLAINNPQVLTESVQSAPDHGKDRLNVHTGKAAPYLAELISARLGLRCHFAVSDYLQRSARHIASAVDVASAWQVGVAAVEMAVTGADRVMVSLQREGVRKIAWNAVPVPLEKVIGKEVGLPRHFIRRDGYGITEACRDYLLPLIQGEDYPPFRHGLPQYAALKKVAVKKKLLPF